MIARSLRLAALAAAVLALPAWADKTVQFQIPVKLEKMDPQVQSFYVNCYLTMSDNNTLAGGTSGAKVPIQNGAYTGMHTVTVTVPEAKLGLVKGPWQCSLRLCGPGAPAGVGVNVGGFSWAKVAPGSTGEVSGSF